MKKLFFTVSGLLAATAARACVSCNEKLQAAIYDSTFYPNLLAMLSAFLVLAIVTATLARFAAKRYPAQLSAIPLATAATVLGIGIGGFIDGILLHQILQWHELLSAKVPPVTVLAKSVNMFWDGIFHAFTLLTTGVGIVLLWKLLHRPGINKSGYLLVGGMLGGWGLFNLIEGIIDHQILGLHHVREQSTSHALWDYGFLLFGVLLMAGGWVLIRKGDKVPM